MDSSKVEKHNENQKSTVEGNYLHKAQKYIQIKNWTPNI